LSGGPVPETITVTTVAFSDGEATHRYRFTCDGANVAPPLAWDGVPEDADPGRYSARGRAGACWDGGGDFMQTVGWHIELEFDEDDTHTRAALLLRLPDGNELRARGHAKRNPADQPQPRIGEEIAAARALSELTHQLLEKAAAEISEVTQRPATIFP